MSNDSGRTNALAGETSPYLLLHKHNPVDWYPWGDEALQRAVDEDKPIFLSVGYSTCYWCHVMERESFSSPEIAALMNEHFVNIKVDREERPDLDEIYMVATQVLTHQGGWPNSVFLTPELVPFFAGTYFPPADAHGRPGFSTVLHSLADAWRNRREDIGEQGESVVGAIRHYLEERDAPTSEPPGGEPAAQSLRHLERQFDRRWGGFGGAPKFPSVPNLWLIEAFAGGEQSEARQMLERSLDQMARGGIYDQLAGGFHRYATDAEWKIPHFEKMLYDNGLLLELYARDVERSGSPQSERIVRETVGFLEREMRSDEGAFWSAIDAETDGAEGAYYVWTQDELVEALGREDAGFLAPLLGFQGAPFFEAEHYVLHWPARLEEQAERRHADPDDLSAEIRPLLDRLLAVRSERKRPLTDEKLLADWNGTAIAGLAEAGRVLADAAALELAADAARFVLERMRSDDGELLHAWRAGTGRVEAFLSDYAFLTRGLLALARATGDALWIDHAEHVVEEQESRLASPEGAWFAAAERPDLIVRSREVYDGALPSASGVAVLNLLELADQTGETTWRERAKRALRAHGSLVERRPDAVRTLALAARRAGGGAAAKSDPGSGAAAAAEIVSAAVEVGAEAGGTRSFELAITVEEGWHIYGHDQELSWVRGTEVRGHDLEIEAMVYPAGDPDPEAGVPIYRGRVVVSGRLRVTGDEPRLAVTAQPCDTNRCLEAVVLELAVAPPSV